ncbi:MAG: hypothetical protein FJ221_06620 [Lentisphaerae bacterium]|nr:hypothetical protein [Lentisphaerota bacterium]
MFNARRPLGIEPPRPRIARPSIPLVGCWLLDVGCWLLNVGCWPLSRLAGRSMFGVRCSMLAADPWVLSPRGLA